MCGLAGVVDLGGLDRGQVGPRLERAVERLHPRGPDDRGSWYDDRCALGHTRLAVIDLSRAASQPMCRAGLVIVYNGEIYNFARLRDELKALGHQFSTESDTEVLLVGWRAWGEALLPRLIGMFAFALWDAAAGELVLVRDRFGKKPLLYWHRGDRLLFASELIALQRLAGTAGTLDLTALRLYFILRYVPEPWSIIEGVKKLPPGHIARFSADGVRVGRWYDLAASRLEPYGDEGEAAADLRRRLDQAVADRLVADVPVGAFLSSGIDSAIVVSAMVASGKHTRTFTVGFDGAAAYYEERPAAKRIADFLGTDHTEIAVSAEATRSVLDSVFRGLDEPFADSSAIPSYVVARETRNHVTVALSGDGADEVFGGYRKYLGELHAEGYRRIPEWLRRGVIEPLVGRLPETKGHPLWERTRRLRRFVAHGGKDEVARQAGWARNLEEGEVELLFCNPPPAPALEDLIAERRAASNSTDSINAMLATDIALGLPGDMLVKIDRMSMASGLEVRCPYLDHRVVECAAAMPGSFKLARGVGKRILRRAFAERLPAELFRRPKKGFEVPIAQWLVGELRDLTRRAIDPARLKKQGLFRPELPERWFAELESGRRDTAWRLWTLIAFHAWCEGQADDGLMA